MKHLFVSTLFTLALATWVSGAEPGRHLFILSGQSNMAGLDPKVSFTPAVEAAFGAERVIVVKDAHSGEPIRRWYKAWKPVTGEVKGAHGDLYDGLNWQGKPIENDLHYSVEGYRVLGERFAAEAIQLIQHGTEGASAPAE